MVGSELAGYWTLQAHIIVDNMPSIILHRKAGLREVGYRERYGHVDGAWHDVMLLERRSRVTGGEGLPTRTCG